MKDFMDLSFKGRIATQPEFDTTKEGLARARFQVAVNRNYKSSNTPSYLTVVYLGSDAEYIRNGFQNGAYFQVGCTIMVNHAAASVRPIQVTAENGSVYNSLELDSVSAKTDRTICIEKKEKKGMPVTYNNGSFQQNMYQHQEPPVQNRQYSGYNYQKQSQNQYSNSGHPDQINGQYKYTNYNYQNQR